MLGPAGKGRVAANPTWKARSAHVKSSYSHNYSTEMYPQPLESEATDCRMHPIEFLAMALLNNPCFAGRKKHKKQRLLHILS